MRDNADFDTMDLLDDPELPELDFDQDDDEVIVDQHFGLPRKANERTYSA